MQLISSKVCDCRSERCPHLRRDGCRPKPSSRRTPIARTASTHRTLPHCDVPTTRSGSMTRSAIRSSQSRVSSVMKLRRLFQHRRMEDQLDRAVEDDGLAKRGGAGLVTRVEHLDEHLAQRSREQKEHRSKRQDSRHQMRGQESFRPSSPEVDARRPLETLVVVEALHPEIGSSVVHLSPPVTSGQQSKLCCCSPAHPLEVS